MPHKVFGLLTKLSKALLFVRSCMSVRKVLQSIAPKLVSLCADYKCRSDNKNVLYKIEVGSRISFLKEEVFAISDIIVMNGI